MPFAWVVQQRENEPLIESAPKTWQRPRAVQVGGPTRGAVIGGKKLLNSLRRFARLDVTVSQSNLPGCVAVGFSRSFRRLFRWPKLLCLMGMGTYYCRIQELGPFFTREWTQDCGQRPRNRTRGRNFSPEPIDLAPKPRTVHSGEYAKSRR